MKVPFPTESGSTAFFYGALPLLQFNLPLHTA